MTVFISATYQARSRYQSLALPLYTQAWYKGWYENRRV